MPALPRKASMYMDMQDIQLLIANCKAVWCISVDAYSFVHSFVKVMFSDVYIFWFGLHLNSSQLTSREIVISSIYVLYVLITATIYVLPSAVCILLWTFTLRLLNRSTSQFPHTVRNDWSYYDPETGKDNSSPPPHHTFHNKQNQ